jgi:hypothetical protein
MSVHPLPQGGSAVPGEDSQVQELLKKYDINGDGKYGVEEVKFMMRDILSAREQLGESKKRRAQLIRIMGAIIVLFFLSVAGNCGMTFVALYALKDTQVSAADEGGSALTSTSGETLMTSSTKAAILPKVHAVGRRRMRTITRHDGRQLQATEVAEVSRPMCEKVVAQILATSDFSGFVHDKESGGVFKGDVVSIDKGEQLLDVDGVVGGVLHKHSLDRSGSGACAIVEREDSGRQLRPVMEEEISTWRRRRLAAVNVEPDAHTFEHFPSCWIYHCFEGDRKERPSRAR